MKSPEKNPRNSTKIFVLHANGAISAFAAEQDAQSLAADGSFLLHDPAELKRATAGWPTARLVGLWNSIPGVIPTKKFTDRATGLKRIWQAIQTLDPVPPRERPRTERSATKTAPGAKKAVLLGLLSRAEGATVREIMAALGWQSHSVRGCLSTLSRRNTAIHSFRRADGERAYATVPTTCAAKEEAQ